MEPRPSSSRQCVTYNGGERIITCGQCNCYLTNTAEMISHRFQGSTGKASLYFRVWNIRCSEKQSREMMTGRHVVRDVECMRCGSKLGWMYEYAHNDDQRYKEQHVILEMKLINEMDGICDPEYGYNGPFPVERIDSGEEYPTFKPILHEEPVATQKHISFKSSRK